MKAIGAVAILLLGASLASGVPAQAGTVEISYDFAGNLTAPPVQVGNLLYLTASATGSVDEFNPVVNAAWNPVTFDTSDALDLTTGLDHGTFTWTFANGETLSGLLFEDDTQTDPATGLGPFAQTLTFTGGTGEFAGVAGSGSGDGEITADGYTLSANGSLSAPGLVGVDEPGTAGLMLGGLLIAFMSLRRLGKRVAQPAMRA